LMVVLGDNPNKLTALADLKKAGIATFAYGNFITILLNFIILAFVIFMMVKAMNKAKAAAEPPAPPPPATPEDVVLLREIRDSLKK
jgi:large conductance mechanosensitive channel